MVVLLAKSSEDIREVVDYAKIIIFRDLGDELRIKVGRIGVKYAVKTVEEKERVLDWLKKLGQVKTVIEVEGAVSDDYFFA